MPEQRALVTGAAGFMGARMCEHLVEEGYDVVGTDLPEADRSAIEDLDMEFEPADLTDPETIEDAVEDVELVFHTAAIFSYSSLLDWETFQEINVEGTRHLCDALLDEDVEAMIHWSTSGVYGPPQTELLPVTEDHPKNPISNYDKSKWEQEQVAMRYEEDYGLPSKAIRPVPVYGPGNTYGAADMFVAIARGYLKVYPTFADHKFPLVHLEDVTRAADHLVDHGESGEAYNLVDEQNYSMNRVIKYVAGLTGQRIYGLPVGDSAYRFIDGVKDFVTALEVAYDKLGREPPFERDALFYAKGNYWISNEKISETGFSFDYPSYEDGVRETIEWLQAEGHIEAEQGVI